MLSTHMPRKIVCDENHQKRFTSLQKRAIQYEERETNLSELEFTFCSAITLCFPNIRNVIYGNGLYEWRYP